MNQSNDLGHHVGLGLANARLTTITKLVNLRKLIIEGDYPAAEMTAYAVSTLVNNPRNEKLACVEPQA